MNYYLFYLGFLKLRSLRIKESESMNTVLITDSSCDLSLDYIKSTNIDVMGIVLNFKGQDSIDDFGATVNYKTFYDDLRNGGMASTAQINTYRFYETFKKYVKEGKSIIYFAFSSGLSGTYNSSLLAKEQILEEFPDADISIVDSLCASMGVGLMVYYANELLTNGASKAEVLKFLEDNKLRTNHYFTVNDLNHLKRGGRVSATAATIGTILDIKPVLHVDKEGHLIPIAKTKGRKKSIKYLFDAFKERVENPEEQVIFISHGDCQQDAEFLADMIRKEYKVKDIMINYIGPVIGAHSGPDTLALFFLGKSRAED